MNFRDWFQSLPVLVQTLLLVAVGFLIASPYWLLWFYHRRQKTILEQDKLARQGEIHLEDPSVIHQAGRWHQNRIVLMVALGSLALIALKGFQWTQGTPWFSVLNVYYIWLVFVFGHKALSSEEFQLERKLSPNLDRRTWILRWAPMFVLLPIMGWLSNSLPIILRR